MGLKEITKDHPNYADYVSCEEGLLKNIVAHIDTWEEFAVFLAETRDAYHAAPSDLHAASLIGLLMSVNHALLSLPEEGDVKVVFAYAMHTVVFRPDVSGFDIVQTAEKAATTMLAGLVHLAETLSRATGADTEQEQGYSPEEAVPAPRTLH